MLRVEKTEALIKYELTEKEENEEIERRRRRTSR
jgi:hypothetical protein